MEISLAFSTRDADLTPGLGRCPEEGNGNSRQCSCLGNPMNRGGWWTIVHAVAESQTQLRTHTYTRTHTHTHVHTHKHRAATIKIIIPIVEKKKL